MKKLCMYALAPAIALALSATAPAVAQEAVVDGGGNDNGGTYDPVSATVNVHKERLVVERIVKVKLVLVASYGIITPDGAAESDVAAYQHNIGQIVDHAHNIFGQPNPLVLDASITGSINDNEGVIQLNQDVGNMVNQGNVASVSITSSETAFTDANAAATQLNAGNLSVTTVPLDIDNFNKQSLIQDSINGNSGIIHVNQNAGDMNNQLNITSAAFGEGSVVALADSQLGQFNTGNLVFDVNTQKRDRILGSVNGNTGIVNVNQSSGKFNNQATMVSFAGSASIGGE